MVGTIDTNLTDGVFRITLNDPARLNAMTPALADELRAQLVRAQGEARVIVLSGAGKAFCAGANLADVMNDPAAAADGGIMLEQHYNPLVRTIRDLEIPLITAVRGAAVGVGASIALLGDIIVASETAYFLQSFRRIGLVPDGEFRDSFRVDVADRNWHKLVTEKIVPGMKKAGFGGVFLDDLLSAKRSY